MRERNDVEGAATALVTFAVSGLFQPRLIAVLGLVYIVGRALYALGYTSAGPKGRLIGALPASADTEVEISRRTQSKKGVGRDLELKTVQRGCGQVTPRKLEALLSRARTQFNRNSSQCFALKMRLILVCKTME